MKNLHLALSLLVLSITSLSDTAEGPGVVESSMMLKLLEPGQVVGIHETGFGYAIRILTTRQIERTIERMEQQRAGFDEQFRGRRREKPLADNLRTPRQGFEAKNPEIGSVYSDHIILRYPNGRERHIATRAIVEVSRYDGGHESKPAGSNRRDGALVSSDQPKDETRDELNLEAGYVQTGMNEVSIVSTVDDPPGLRLGVKREEGWGRSLGKFSFNSVRPDRVQDECVLIQGKLDERFPPADLVGEYIFFLRTPPGGGDEGDMVKVLTLQHDQIVAHVPVIFERGGTASR